MYPVVYKEPRQTDFSNICENCPIGCCCRAKPPLTAKRKEAIQDFSKTTNLEISNPFEDAQYSYPKESEEGCCIFLDNDKKRCRIHPVKPETCVAGPITFDINVQAGKIEWFLKNERICPLAGALFRDGEALEKHVKSAKSEILRLVEELNEDALRAILTIEEPDTFKIDEDNIDLKIIEKLKTSI